MNLFKRLLTGSKVFCFAFAPLERPTVDTNQPHGFNPWRLILLLFSFFLVIILRAPPSIG